MLQKEFEQRTNIKLTGDEFSQVHDIYMACGDDVEKGVFCDLYMTGDGRLQLLRIITGEKKITEKSLDIISKKLRDAQEQQEVKDMELAEFLVGKASAYEDTDFYNEAVRLIGQCEVVLMKLRMNLPLWEEDKDYIKKVLENDIQGKKVAG